MIGIYKITDKKTNKCYIGQSINIGRRFEGHIFDFENDNGLKKNYPELEIKNLTFEIVELCEEEELDNKERYWIKYYDSFFNGFNRTMGGKTQGEEEKEFYQKQKENSAIDKIKISEEYLNKWLTFDECRELAERLSVPETDKQNAGKKMSWNKLKKFFPSAGYTIEQKRKNIKGKLQQCYYITSIASIRTAN